MNLQNVCKMRNIPSLSVVSLVVLGLFCGQIQRIESASFRPQYLQNSNGNNNSISNNVNDTNSGDEGLGHRTEAQIRGLLRNIVPTYMQDIANLNLGRDWVDDIVEELSPDCLGHSLEWYNRIQDYETIGNDTWILHMIDAWGKPPEGILSGHINALGDYDECVGIRAKNVKYTDNPYQFPNLTSQFRGRYCNIPFGPKPPGKPSTSASKHHPRKAVSLDELIALINIREGVILYPSLAVCFPSSCDRGNITRILEAFFDYIESTELYPLGVAAHCYTDEKPDFGAGDYSMLGLLGFLGLLILLATSFDVALNRDSGKKDADKPKRKPSTGAQFLLAFSLKTNVTKWLSTRSGGDNLGCLHGLRFLSTLWVILAHTWYVITFLPSYNMVDMKLVHEDWTILTILNSTISVDTFFVMSGLLVSYNLLKMFQKTNGRLNLPMFYIHRYLRLTPTYAILVGIMATVFPYLGSGPFWYIMDNWSMFCEKYWWTNLLYINNLVHTDTMCQGEAWYLANDMQFYIVSPILIWPLWKWNIPGKILLGIITVLSILAPGLLVHYLDTTPTTIGTRDIGRWFIDIYITPWSRAQTYIVGIWIGYLLFKTKGVKVRIPKLVSIACWLISTGTALSVLYGIYPYFDPQTAIPDVERLLYACFNRFAWGLVIAWIIFACVHGYGGFVNSFLSWKVFIPLGRLTFCTYLVSLHLQMILHLQFRQTISYDVYTMTNFFFAHMVMALLAGFICTITMESPFIQIEKLVFSGSGSGPRPPPPKPPAKRYGIFYNSNETIFNSLDNKDEEVLEVGESNNNGQEKNKPEV